MTHNVKAHGLDAELTDEHSASSYGQMVLVVRGEAFGPADLIPTPDGGEAIPAYSSIHAPAPAGEATHAAVAAFKAVAVDPDQAAQDPSARRFAEWLGEEV